MNDISSIILERLAANASKGMSVYELLFDGAPLWREYFQQQLNELWRAGKAYVSRIERTPTGYQPDTEANWTVARLEGFYGYDPRWGAYQISSRAVEPLAITQEATLSTGFQIHAIAVAPNGDDFVVGGKSETILLGSLSRGTFEREFAGKSRVWCLAFSPQHGQQFVSGQNDGQIVLWSKSGGQVGMVGETGDRVTAVCYSPDGARLVSAHQLRNKQNYPVRMWRVVPPDVPTGMGHHSENVYAIGYLRDGQGIVSAGSGKVVKHYSLTEQRELYASKTQTGTISCLAVHPKINLVVTGSWSGKLNVYDLMAYEELQVVEAHISRVTALAFSPSGHLLASGSRDSQIAIWQIPQATLLKRMVAHNGWVRALAFASDDTLLSGGTDGLCKVWRLNYAGQIPSTEAEILNELRKDRGETDD